MQQLYASSYWIIWSHTLWLRRVGQLVCSPSSFTRVFICLAKVSAHVKAENRTVMSGEFWHKWWNIRVVQCKITTARSHTISNDNASVRITLYGENDAIIGANSYLIYVTYSSHSVMIPVRVKVQEEINVNYYIISTYPVIDKLHSWLESVSS